MACEWTPLFCVFTPSGRLLLSIGVAYAYSKGIGGHVMGLEETAAQFPLVPDKDNNFSLLDSVGSLFLGKSSPVSNLTTPISVIQEIILQVSL